MGSSFSPSEWSARERRADVQASLESRKRTASLPTERLRKVFTLGSQSAAKRLTLGALAG